ncbi:hypothetical protein [Ideonella sp. BN130291]|uniref:hypothetical protein n=1 Tax=Ideonella sp. BN130291 TaxID=3112940 RepID=UPI002E25C45A|nr:hypothetical protein [Ideonella sp. BN130291]
MFESDRSRDASANEAHITGAPVAPPADAAGAERWRALLTLVGSEIAGPLTAAMERITALTTTGKIDRQSLRALRDEVEAARRAGMVGQQLARFASGRVRQSHERLNLTQLLKDVLVQRGRDLQARGLPLRQALKPAEVIADASLLFAMFNALLDWCAEHARSTIDLRLDHTTWPVQARLACRFAFRPAGDLPPDEPLPSLDSLAWHLVQQAAWTMGLKVEREETGIESTATLVFPRTVNRELEGVSAVEIDHGFPSSLNSKPLAGSHVLVVASRREVRSQVREAIAHMGLILDFVTSIDEAREFCSGGLPHAVVYEAVLGGERLEHLRQEIQQEVPDLVFVEIVEEGDVFQVSGFGGPPVARVGREGLHSALPSVLVFELSKGL